jgi:hypothetical protein
MQMMLAAAVLRGLGVPSYAVRVVALDGSEAAR